MKFDNRYKCAICADFEKFDFDTGKSNLQSVSVSDLHPDIRGMFERAGAGPSVFVCERCKSLHSKEL